MSSSDYPPDQSKTVVLADDLRVRPSYSEAIPFNTIDATLHGKGRPTLNGLTLTDVFQFLLEIAALVSIGYWGWTRHSGLSRGLTAIGLPILVAILWAIFRVPDESGSALIAIPALLRLGLEIGSFGLAAICLYTAGKQDAAILLDVIVIAQYVFSGRFVFLLTHS